MHVHPLPLCGVQRPIFSHLEVSIFCGHNYQESRGNSDDIWWSIICKELKILFQIRCFRKKGLAHFCQYQSFWKNIS